MIWALAAVAVAAPHTDAAATVAVGYVGFGPGVAARGSATFAYWGWAHADALIAARVLQDVGRTAPFGLVGLEVGFSPPFPRGAAGVAVAYDRAWDPVGVSCFDRLCVSPYAGVGIGAVWAIETERRSFEAFVGAGAFSESDIPALSWRLRLAWTLRDRLRLGVVGTGKQDLLVEIGVAW